MNFYVLSGDHNNTNGKIKKRLYSFVNDLFLKEDDCLYSGKLRLAVIQCVTNWYRRSVINPFY